MVDNLEKKIDELLERSLEAVFPSKHLLKKALLSGKKLRIYVGADATGPDLHLGHSTNYLLLEKLRELGHTTIVLFGDFTAMIGDPTDKSAMRIALSKGEVDKNIKTWKRQLAPIVRFSTFGGSTKIVKNSAWLSKLGFSDLVNLASGFTVQQMLERDMFANRIKEEKPIRIHEFLYPLMQGYDSVALDVDIEIGGNDQTFNMLTGRILQKKYNNKEKFVIATTLLTNPLTGKKLMSKSEGGYVSLKDLPRDMFGKIMALPDEVIRQMFVDCTKLSMHRIEEILNISTNPRDQKLILAEEIVSMYHGKSAADKAKQYFIDTFSSKKISEDVPEIICDPGSLLSDMLLSAKIIDSKSGFTRLIRDGAVSKVAPEEKKIEDIFAKAEEGTYKIGKHRFIKIKIK